MKDTKKRKKIRIQSVSTWSIIITIVLAVIFAAVSASSEKEFRVPRLTTDEYILCQNSAKKLQDGSDYLTEQVRMYAMTGKTEYRDLYFEEANTTRRREKALEELKKYFADTDSFTALETALSRSQELMETEYYSMRLVAESYGKSEESMPEEIRDVQISSEDAALSAQDKRTRAQDIVCDTAYQSVRNEITDNVTECMNSLIRLTRNRQGRASTIFSDMYLKLEISIAVLVAMMLVICMLVRKLIVQPLVSYNESIKLGEIFPVIGAAELQNLAETYNKVYQENQETQKLICHQAEHDSMTDLLNRGAFEKILNIYENGEPNFALLLVDVDTFKSVNDTYGHAMGDKILKKVSKLLKDAFRSIDYVCRIGGDEFAIIMVEMTSDLQYTISDKVKAVNERLAMTEDGTSAVSLSVGVAFADRENPGESIFKDADKALYRVKENGRNGCAFY